MRKDGSEKMRSRLLKLLVFVLVLAAAFIPAVGVRAEDDDPIGTKNYRQLKGKVVQPGDDLHFVNDKNVNGDDDNWIEACFIVCI